MTTINKPTATGIVLTSPQYNNPVAIDAGVSVTNNVGGGNGIAAYSGFWTITNAGYVAALGAGGASIYLTAGGVVTNQSGGVISARNRSRSGTGHRRSQVTLAIEVLDASARPASNVTAGVGHGSLAAVNAALDDANVMPNPEFEGTHTLTFTSIKFACAQARKKERSVDKNFTRRKMAKMHSILAGHAR
jgi:hypothetical protein